MGEAYISAATPTSEAQASRTKEGKRDVAMGDVAAWTAISCLS